MSEIKWQSLSQWLCCFTQVEKGNYRQSDKGMQNVSGLHGKGLTVREKKERILLSERANTKPATESSLPAETTIHTAGPGGNPFFDVSWLAFEEVNQQESGTQCWGATG